MNKNILIRKYTILLILICIATSFYAQEGQRKHYLGSHVSFDRSDYLSGGRVLGSDWKDYAATSYFTIGLDYALYISNITEMRTGLSVTSNDMRQTNHYFGDWKTYEYDQKFFMFSVPWHLKVHFLKYLFIDGGACFNYHPSMGYTWGIGAGIGIGAEYTFKSAISVSAGYQFQWNFLNLFSSQQNDNSVGIDQLNQRGFVIGLGYRF